MSKVAPHNSFVEFIVEDGKRIAVKNFQQEGKYTAAQEAQSYLYLGKLLDKIEGVRIANVIRLDEENNTLRIEYIPGMTLYEKIINGDEACLAILRKSLIDLFLMAKNDQVYFDSDPSNIMFDSKGIVLIDPVSSELSIEDYCFIVFMWGLIKVSLRNRRFWRIRKLIPYWGDYYREYCHLSGTNNFSLNKQMVNYIDLVSNWNKERNTVEGNLFYIFRRIVVIPIYIMIKQVFQWNCFRW